jgi:hypothetical protein
LSPGARPFDKENVKERHIVPDESDDEEEENELSVNSRDDEPKELMEPEETTMSRFIEYLVEKINDFTDYMGCTDTD